MKDYYSEDELVTMGFKSIGKDVRVSKNAIIRNPENVSIGNHVAIDPFVYISVSLDVGDYVHISRYVSISGPKECFCCLEGFNGIAEGCRLIVGSDDFSGESLLGPTIPIQYRKVTLGKIILQKHAQLATNVVVFPNVIIGEGSVVGACSLVTKTLDPWGFYFGIPVIRHKERSRKLLRYEKELSEKEKLGATLL